AEQQAIDVVEREHEGGGRTAFLRASALDTVTTTVERGGYFTSSRHFRDGIDVTDEVAAERRTVSDTVAGVIEQLIDADVAIDNDELFCLHRLKDGRDIYFVVKPTGEPPAAEMSIGRER